MLTRLPHTVTIQTETRTLFEGGAYTTSWTTASTQWANVQPISAVETYGEEKKQQETKYRIITINPYYIEDTKTTDTTWNKFKIR